MNYSKVFSSYNESSMQFVPFVKKHWFLLLIIGVGFIVHMAIMFPFGWQYCVNDQCGIWFADIYRARDELWHMSLGSAAFYSLPFKMPIYVGEYLMGYHYLYGFTLFLLKTFQIPILLGNFFINPIIWFSLYTYLSILLAKKIRNSKQFISLFLFFQYFGSSFGYLFALYHKKTLFANSGPGYQSLTYLTNLPLAFSFLPFIGILYIFTHEKLSRKSWILVSLLIFLLWGFKFYSAVAAGLFIGFELMLRLFNKKITVVQVFTAGLSLIGVSLIAIYIFYNPQTATKTGGIFQFKPFATVNPIVENKDEFYLPGIANSLYILHFGPRYIVTELAITSIAFIFMVGTRIIALYSVIQKIVKKQIERLDVTLSLSALITFILMILLVQKGDWFNTTQFFPYGMMIMNIYAALTLHIWLKSKSKLGYIMIGIVLIATLLGCINVFYRNILHILPKENKMQLSYFEKPIYISNEEIEALHVLAQQEDGIVFQFPFVTARSKYTLKPIKYEELWYANDTAYVPALSGKQVYYTHTNQLILTGIDYKKREKEVMQVSFKQLKSLPVTYFYLVKAHPYFDLTKHQINKNDFEVVYENKKVLLLKRVKHE